MCRFSIFILTLTLFLLFAPLLPLTTSTPTNNRKILHQPDTNDFTPFFFTYPSASASLLAAACAAVACALFLAAVSAFVCCLRRRKSCSADSAVRSFPCEARNTSNPPELEPLLPRQASSPRADDQEEKFGSPKGLILESESIRESEESNSVDDVGVSDDEAETEILLHFLISLREEKKKQAAKVEEELNFLNEDIKEVESSYSFETDAEFPLAQKNNTEVRGNSIQFQDSSSSDTSRSIRRSFVDEERFMSTINQLENAYFSARFQVLPKEASSVSINDKNVMESRLRLPYVEVVNKEPRRIQSSVGCLASFCEGLCKFASCSKFEECGRLRNGDPLTSANIISALSFDRDEDYIAAAGVSRKIKIFDLNAISSDSTDIQDPVVEMSNSSKLSCVCWNTYIKNHLASADYDGVVQMWDAGTGQPLSQYMEHKKRAWSVHFSLSDPKMFASGSDDCSVKLWNISERNSLGTIRNRANICCVQFSPSSTNLLFFGSADHKIYGYDLRHTRIPWCTLAGHGKAVSYVKFIDAEAVVSASTDNSLKLWDLKKTSSSGLSSDACVLTFQGHRNKKNFVGLSVLDGYIACGSESNEVYCYHKSLPVPIATHKFESIDPISGHLNSDDNNGQFVTSVCWRKKSNMLAAANSVGIVKLLQMV